MIGFERGDRDSSCIWHFEGYIIGEAVLDVSSSSLPSR